ncbi:MAG: transcriptional regulator NrdR [Candidatus Chisholmbacteria bacterium RIFCSPLOWO2_01_FULL_50_28]|uniref:Transcriptional repressor NrdR n=1 Tax=Candidatus Chisholmbacteria bacterium RIFCSPHIGHO2_01_FULL_52_32 TaxID=1797591 RepID=A0A1G1VR47_9BACT|nr:MAG: transcriptional regulator NrdR [Candidatus Chisholmbacteria bacterium RIFCSPHIGHO2_01_FULL_52_32]OGY20695.1 MAG: transcriptional regulator NrdR [Candidatus Chisholmbacteria bacterium RIFCSPLOWO2_01_FULL_50_28]
MKCPYCGTTESSVLESRISEDEQSIRRRRECERCAKRFTTYERVEGLDLVVIKKDGRRESFDRDKLRKGLMKATWKRPVTIEQIESLVEEVEQKLRARANKEVKSWEIGKLVVTRLRKLDPVGYILFASVYRDFQDIDDFKREIERLGKHVT